MNTTGLLVLLLVILLGVGGGAVWIRGEGTPPAIESPEAVLVGKAGGEVALAIADEGSGLRSLDVVLIHGGGEIPLLRETYPGNLLSGGVRIEHAANLPIGKPVLGAMKGEGQLRITSRDWSWRDLFSGNEAVREIPFTVDLEPPRVSVTSGLTYVRQGGAGLVNYRVSEATAFDGVRVGTHLYRGHPRPGGANSERVALFAIPADAPAEVEPIVVARDPAGNEATARWPAVVKKRSQPKGNVTLSAGFLENVVPRLASTDTGGDLAAAFHDVNTKTRAENEAQIRAELADTAETPLFDGALSQLRNSQVTSRFAEDRTYFVDGKPVSQAVHYGYDLASTSADVVPAAAAGRIAFAGELGIYGNCVLIDHGLGLGTLYGHLSRLDVEAGDAVTDGQAVGLTGATGLAGGDHLHFAVLVGDTYVDPLEWWDDKWVETHVTVRLHAPGS